nr:hypothetical protein Iba_chr02bCG8240 [Ipomoea batatas]
METTSCGLESNKGSEVTSCDLKAQKKDKVLPKHRPNTPPTTKMNTWVRKDMEEPEDTILGAMKLKLNATRLAKVEKLKKLQVLGGKYFDLPLLYSFGCRREVKYLIAHPRWDRVFGWRWDTYAPVVYEFIATLQLKKEMYHNKPSTSFTIFNKKHDLLVNELGWCNTPHFPYYYFKYKYLK